MDRSASTTLEPLTPGAKVAGLDWAWDDHVVAVVDDRGREVDRLKVAHDKNGLRGLLRFLDRHDVTEVALERGDGPVVDTLLAAGTTVVVIAPQQVKHLRSRYGSAGNKDDRFDAFVLADTLRTDRTRLRVLRCDDPATVRLREVVRARRDLVKMRVAAANQLRAHLQIAFPAATTMFADVDSDITRTFLRRFTTQDQADWLSERRLAAWLRAAGYCGRTSPAALYRRLREAPDGLRGTCAQRAASVTCARLTLLDTLHEQTRELTDQIVEQLDLHPDGPIFTSLPRSGKVRAARLLAEIGDVREKFPTAASLACLAGVAPSTRQSGRRHVVTFRWSCNKELRDAVCDFAGDSRRANPWAARHYDRARARGHDHPHAVRVLARSWIDIIWRCWQNATPYDPTHHGALQALLHTEPAATG